MHGTAELVMERPAARGSNATLRVFEERLRDAAAPPPSLARPDSAAWREIAALPDAMLGAERTLAGWRLPPGFPAAARLQVIASAACLPAATMARDAIERACGLPVDLASAAAFQRRAPRLPPRTAIAMASGPGEAAEMRAALQAVAAQGLPMISLGPVPACPPVPATSGAAVAQGLIPGGPCILSQAHALMRLGIALGEAGGRGDAAFREDLAWALATLPVVLAAAMAHAARLHGLATRIAAAGEVLLIGRGAGAALAQVGALDLTHGAGLHAEVLAAEDLPQLMAEPLRQGMPVILCAPTDEHLPAALEDARALRGRGADVSVLMDAEGTAAARALDAEMIVLPGAGVAGCFAIAFALRLLAVQAAEALGFDADRPWHLVGGGVADWAPAA